MSSVSSSLNNRNFEILQKCYQGNENDSTFGMNLVTT